MDLISRKSVAEKMLYRRDYVGRPSDPDCIIADEPSVPAVPLDKLCEWLAKNASWYAVENEGDSEEWKSLLIEWMEEQDAAEKDT